jgi:hypothetical protein|tara:strand:+ start:1878 stop:2219 length:342 start_codon:yes stop_codon:yes gene_type:complete
MKPKAFMLFVDNKTFIDKLSTEQAGHVFKAIYEYADSGKEPTDLCPLCDMVFSMFRLNLDKAKTNYDDVCKKRAEAGRRGGLARASKAKQSQANASNSNSNNKKKKGWVGIDE